jgi:NAD(P)-dependent dehydrogenase (short-subunit alcohol dehydrogenase family)
VQRIQAPADASQRVALVTGASAGIGLAIAAGLARLGYSLVLGVRDQGRGEAARRTIIAASPGARVSLGLVDTGRPASIRALFGRLAELPRLDVLVNNAGVAPETRQETPEGLELCFAVNVLGYFVAGELATPLLARTGGRIVNVASQYAGGLELDDLELRRRGWERHLAYRQTKEADRLLSWDSGRRFRSLGVTANAYAPGAVATRMLKSFFPGMQGRSPAEGADTGVWLAADTGIEGMSGRFFMDRREISCEFRDEELETRLGERLREIAGF